MKKNLIRPDASLEPLEINIEENKYICKIQIIDELIYTNIILYNKVKYKGRIFLEKIQSQIKAFFDYNIYEIFEEINHLNSNNFSLINEYKQYKLRIKFTILRKEKYIFIDLNENKLNNFLYI